MPEYIIVHRKTAGGRTFAEILLNRPAKGNALTLPMLDEIASAVDDIAADSRIKVVIIRGAGRFFCAGGDIQAWGHLSAAGMSDWILRGVAVLQKIANLPQPVIAVIHGPALGGGLELALAADLRLATRAATFGAPETKIGMVAGWGGVRRLAEKIGAARAQHLTLLGDPISASDALQWGLITGLTDNDGALEKLLEIWVNRLLANSSSAMALTKGLLATAHTDLTYQHAAAASAAIITPDCAEGVAAFTEKRPPKFVR